MGACLSETVVMGADALVGEAANDVECGVVAVDGEKAVKCSAGPTKCDAFAGAEELSLVWDPLGGKCAERLAEPAGRIGEASTTQGRNLLSSGGGVGTLLIDTVFPSAVGPVLVEGIANNGAEVAREGTEVFSMQLRPELGLGVPEHLERVAAVGIDELRDGDIEAIDLVQVSEQQAPAVLVGACSIASASGSTNEGFFVKARALLDSSASGTSACLVGTKKGGDEEMTETLGKLDIAQSRVGFCSPVRQSEHGRGDCLEDPEASFHGALAERIAFALGSVFGSELGESLAGQLGHVRRSLIGDRLQTFTAGDGRGQYLDHVLGVFMVVEDDCVEEILIAATDILGGHQLERHSKHRQVGGVSADLSVGDDQVEPKAWAPLSAGTRLARLGARARCWTRPWGGLWSWWIRREP
jgi:hypothetical protein